MFLPTNLSWSVPGGWEGVWGVLGERGEALVALGVFVVLGGGLGAFVADCEGGLEVLAGLCGLERIWVGPGGDGKGLWWLLGPFTLQGVSQTYFLKNPFTWIFLLRS